MRELIAVWFSCGAASAVAAKLTLERYGATHEVRIINNPVAEENADNRRFLRDVSQWIGREIEIAACSKYPSGSAVEVWERERFMSSPQGASCTKYLKKRARQEWEERNKPDFHVLGFAAEERKRHEKFILTERPNVLPVLIEAGLTRAGCAALLMREGLRLPLTYDEGWPNANCEGCVKATSPTYWNFVRDKRPAVFAARAELSRRLGVRLVRVRGERKFLDELLPTDTGAPLKNLRFECGIFCEEHKEIETMKAYYARPISIDNTPQFDRDLALIRALGFDPSPTPEEKVAILAEYKTVGMEAFKPSVEAANALVYRSFPDGSIGSGVAQEIAWAMAKGIPVVEIPRQVDRRSLNAEQTRAMLCELGQR